MLQLFTLLIVPNISITEDDLEEYEMEPEQYIKNDIRSKTKGLFQNDPERLKAVKIPGEQ